MAGRIARSWELGKQSWRVLREDKRLMVFPLLSTLACILVLASFAVPVIMMVDFEALDKTPEDAPLPPWYYLGLFAFYFVNYSVIAFFNAALIACAMRRFEGKEAGVGAGLKFAASRLPQIMGWALVSSTVGVILRAIAENTGFLGRIVVALMGFVWSIATYFVVPVLVVEGLGPIAAVKRSTSIITKTWGEALVLHVGLSAVTMLCGGLALLPLGAGIALSIVNDSPVWLVGGMVITFATLIALALITSTMQTIVVAALYRYASTGEVPGGFDGELLKQVFQPKKK